MLIRITSVVTLLALLNCILGCTTVTSIPMDEARVPPAVKIMGVKYKSGEYVKFINHDGVYDKLRDRIYGQVEFGKDRTFKFSELDSIKVANYADWPSQSYFIGKSDLKRLFSRKPQNKITATVLHSGEKIRFDSNHGRFNVDNQAVVGTDSEGRTVSLPYDDVASIQASVYSGKKTFTLFGILGFVALGSVGLWLALD